MPPITPNNEPLPEARILTDVITNTTETSPEETPAVFIFNKKQQQTLYAVLGLFGISTLGGVIGGVTGISIFLIAIMAWYPAAIIGVVTGLSWFIIGLLRITEDRGRMLGSAVAFILLVLIVGGGTCAINVAGM